MILTVLYPASVALMLRLAPVLPAPTVAMSPQVITNEDSAERQADRNPDSYPSIVSASSVPLSTKQV